MVSRPRFKCQTSCLSRPDDATAFPSRTLLPLPLLSNRGIHQRRFLRRERERERNWGQASLATFPPLFPLPPSFSPKSPWSFLAPFLFGIADGGRAAAARSTLAQLAGERVPNLTFFPLLRLPPPLFQLFSLSTDVPSSSSHSQPPPAREGRREAFQGPFHHLP